AFDVLARIEDEMNRIEAETEAQMELTQELSGQDEQLLARFRQLEHQSTLDDELSRLKLRMAGPADDELAALKRRLAAPAVAPEQASAGSSTDEALADLKARAATGLMVVPRGR